MRRRWERASALATTAYRPDRASALLAMRMDSTTASSRADYISTADTIRKFILRVSVAVCPWSPRPPTEPAGRADHALHRARRLRARLARQTRCSMAAVQLRHRRSSEVTLGDAVMHHMTSRRSASHRGGTQWHALSAAAVSLGAPEAAQVHGSITASRAACKQCRPAEHDDCRARGRLARRRASRA